MKINDQKTIREIQEEFQTHFPNLKLEFYAFTHKPGEGNTNQSLINANRKIEELRTIHNDGDLSINGHQKISTLESNFEKKYGLNVQVFRRSGDLWLQTTSTDFWTLSDQNKKGELSLK